MGGEISALNLSNVWILEKMKMRGHVVCILAVLSFLSHSCAIMSAWHFIVTDPVSMLAQWGSTFHSFELLVDTSLLSARWSNS